MRDIWKVLLVLSADFIFAQSTPTTLTTGAPPQYYLCSGPESEYKYNDCQTEKPIPGCILQASLGRYITCASICNDKKVGSLSADKCRDLGCGGYLKLNCHVTSSGRVHTTRPVSPQGTTPKAAGGNDSGDMDKVRLMIYILVPSVITITVSVAIVVYCKRKWIKDLCKSAKDRLCPRESIEENRSSQPMYRAVNAQEDLEQNGGVISICHQASPDTQSSGPCNRSRASSIGSNNRDEAGLLNGNDEADEPVPGPSGASANVDSNLSTSGSEPTLNTQQHTTTET